jgi:hypothetical protein
MICCIPDEVKAHIGPLFSERFLVTVDNVVANLAGIEVAGLYGEHL